MLDHLLGERTATTGKIVKPAHRLGRIPHNPLDQAIHLHHIVTLHREGDAAGKGVGGICCRRVGVGNRAIPQGIEGLLLRIVPVVGVQESPRSHKHIADQIGAGINPWLGGHGLRIAQ